MQLATPQQLLLLVLHNRHKKSQVKHCPPLSPQEKIQYSYLMRKHRPTRYEIEHVETGKYATE